METGGFKYGGKFGKLKDDKNYVSGNDGDNFQEKVIKNIFENWNKDYKCYVNVLSLTNKLKENME